jgi:hypothetical protein
MSTNIIAYLLLIDFRSGGLVEDFAARVDNIRKSLKLSSIDISFEGDSMDIVKHALRIFDTKVTIDEKLIIRPREETNILIELRDYAQTFMCHYALQSALVLSAERLKRVHNYIDYDKMIDMAMDLCDIVHLEIPFYLPCINIKEQLQNAFDILSANELMTKPIVVQTMNEIRARNIAKYFDDSNSEDEDDNISESDCASPENCVTINVDKQKEINMLKGVLLPILTSYKNVAHCIKRMVGYKMMKEDLLLRESMDVLDDKCQSQQCKYLESCSSAWIKNCLKLFEEWQIIGKVAFSSDQYYIMEKYNNETEIGELENHIKQFCEY